MMNIFIRFFSGNTKRHIQLKIFFSFFLFLVTRIYICMGLLDDYSSFSV